MTETADDRDPVTLLEVPTSIEIQHTASLPESAFRVVQKESAAALAGEIPEHDRQAVF